MIGRLSRLPDKKSGIQANHTLNTKDYLVEGTTPGEISIAVFQKKYPHFEICYPTFLKYAGMINVTNVFCKVQKLFKQTSLIVNVERRLQLIASQNKAPVVYDKMLEQI